MLYQSFKPWICCNAEQINLTDRLIMIKSPLKRTINVKRAVVDPYLDTFLIIDPADHPHTHLCNLTEGWLLEADISEDLDHPFPYADTSVLHIKNDSIYTGIVMFCNHFNKKRLSFSYQKRHICMGCNWGFSANRWQYETVMKIELLMNPSQHFHDNRNNNFKAFTSHLPSIKEQVQSFCVCLTSCQYP